MASKIWRNLIRTAAVACFVAGSTAQAGGVFYQSDFDPLGFAGSAKWFVDDNCGLGGKGNGYYLVNALGPACNVSLYSLTVQLWESNPTSAAFPDVDAARANPVGSKFLELEFDSEYTTPPSASPYHVFGLPDPHLVVGISVLNHKLAGLEHSADRAGVWQQWRRVRWMFWRAVHFRGSGFSGRPLFAGP